MIIICHLLVTFFKVNTDYFKYNYKFDKSEIVEAEVFYKQRKTIKQSRNRINLNFWYNGEEYLQEYLRGLLNMQEEKTCLHVIKTVEAPDTVILCGILLFLSIYYIHLI